MNLSYFSHLLFSFNEIEAFHLNVFICCQRYSVFTSVDTYLDYHRCLCALCSSGHSSTMIHCYSYAHPGPSLAIQLVAHLCILFVIAPNLDFCHISRAHTSTANCMVCQTDAMPGSWSSFYSKRDVALPLIQHWSMNVAVHHVVLNADLWVGSLHKFASKLNQSFKMNMYLHSTRTHTLNEMNPNE